MEASNAYILTLEQTDHTKVALVGGKGANLVQLRQIEGLNVPDGFCVTTHAYRKALLGIGELDSLLDQLNTLQACERKDISQISAQIRRLIEQAVIPADIELAIIEQVAQIDVYQPYAVRSSATTEDLPAASFAGQQDTFLNIIGRAEILKHIIKCWASMFTERAVSYRLQNGFDHKKVYLAVVVQKMIHPDASGVMFTADPLSGNRKVISIDAGFGLGEALVSGLINADHYEVRDGKLTDKKVSVKTKGIFPLTAGGTETLEIEPSRQNIPVLTDGQILELALLGRTIEAHFCQLDVEAVDRPQDIEWCLMGGTFFIVQSRPITTVYPIPDDPGNGLHVYLSVGHQQMMTDAMTPLGLSMWLLTTRAPMRTAGGRLFVDITPMLASTNKARSFVDTLGKSDPLIRDALNTILQRGDFTPEERAGNLTQETVTPPGKPALGLQPMEQNNDWRELPSHVVTDLIRDNEASLAILKENIGKHEGVHLFDFILEDLKELKRILFDPKSHLAIMASINAYTWINEKMYEWLGEKNAADALAQSVDNNITSEMGLALLDVADAIRPFPGVVTYLTNTKEEDILRKLPGLDGGNEVRAAIEDYLNKYGMRCAGEIDMTKTRWSEKPSVLSPLIVSNINNFGPGESARKFEQGRNEALKKEQMLTQLLMQLPDGEEKAGETKKMIDLIRNFAGYREYPKYGMINRYFVYKQALLREARKLTEANIIDAPEDVFYLSFDEFREVVETGDLDKDIVSKRRREHEFHQKLTPPRVLTSDGEMIRGSYQSGAFSEPVPDGAIVGLPVSSGIVEGRARVILNMENADIQEGDILVTAFTDPSWTPLFVLVKGLVTEVGGLMTHGAVVAREYGLPAVVGVENATKTIQDGQMIRVNGTDGFVEFL